MRSWIYHDPVFDCDQDQPVLMKYAPWSGLRYLVYDLVCDLLPGTIVELGTHYGCSAFTFLQAMKDYRMPGRFFTIDHWKGDSLTENDYRDPVCEEFLSIFEKHYEPYTKAEIWKGTFQECRSLFGKQEIDLLHIDGSHCYEDVKRDYMLWEPLVNRKGAILLHDTGSRAYKGRPLGSGFFWNELKKQKKELTMEIPFSCGLGILFKDRRRCRYYRKRLAPDYYRRKNEDADEEKKAMIREQYFRLRDLERYNRRLLDHAAELREEKSYDRQDGYSDHSGI